MTTSLSDGEMLALARNACALCFGLGRRVHCKQVVACPCVLRHVAALVHADVERVRGTSGGAGRREEYLADVALAERRGGGKVEEFGRQCVRPEPRAALFPIERYFSGS